MLYAFFLLGTPWFWLPVILPFLFLIWFVENERAWGAVLTLVITAAVFVAFGDKALIPWVMAHPLTIAEYIAGYVGVGILWGIVKWFFHVLRARDQYENYRAEFVKDMDGFYRSRLRADAHNKLQKQRLPHQDNVELQARLKEIEILPKVTEFSASLFKAFLKERHSIGYADKQWPPRVGQNKGRIIFWMSYWPASALWTLINDPITRLYRFLFKRLTAIFEGITNSMFAKYKDELAASEAE